MIAGRYVPLALAALLAVAAPASAQETLLDRVRAALPSEEAARVERLGAEAGAAGVSADLLYGKALEGTAKGVPVERIVAAVEDYSLRLAEARELVGPEPDGATLSVAADALRRGASPEAIRSVVLEHPGEAAIPILVLGELAETGVPVEHALEVVTEALERGEGDERLLNVSADVRQRVRAGERPDRAAREAGRAAIGLERGASQAAPGRGKPGASSPTGPPVPPGSGPPGQAKKGERPGRPR